ncbi:MAG TPA: Rha family transcriptional regulator [Epulopiscium sp.]|nr:Rha family transcriptional regulator [Candidatus Epulonipiscium sp.]
MDELTIINQGGHLLVDSREVAKMIEIRHSDLLEKISGYITHLENGKLRSLDFFTPSSYLVDGNSRSYPCFLLTRKGCDMVANKMTGEKGIIFTAIYVTKFEEMEKQQGSLKHLSPQLQILINMELKQNQLEAAVTKASQVIVETKQDIQNMKDAITINPQAEWRKETNKVLLAIGKKIGCYSKPKQEAYNALQVRGKCRPNVLVSNLKKRALENGMAPSRVKELNLLDVLENNPRLREIYITIVKEMAIKYL